MATAENETHIVRGQRSESDAAIVQSQQTGEARDQRLPNPVHHSRPQGPLEVSNPLSTICKVVYKGQSGTGALYGFEFHNEVQRILFITSNEILNIIEVADIRKLRLEFENKTIGRLNPTPDWVEYLWTSPRDELNVTVIQFSTIAIEVFITNDSKYVPLEHASPVENEQLGGELKGNIIEIMGDHFNFKIETKSERGGGVPLLNKDLKVVGIYNGVWDEPNESDLQTHKATNIQSVLKGFKEYIVNEFGGEIENEKWLYKLKDLKMDDSYRLGKGGYGAVYEFKDPKTSEVYAVKVVGGYRTQNELADVVSALKKEYKVVLSLGSHPRIIQFFAIVPDQTKARIMIVMEYMEGGSLEDKIKKENPLPDKSVLRYLYQILEGVCFLHLNKIYHSDIKPANILLSKDNNLKISDFGIAVGVGEQFATMSSATTSYNNRKGDFYYMSPERLKGEERRGVTNDIWSIGATLVHMLSGHPLNHIDPPIDGVKIQLLIKNISEYNLSVNGKPYSEYLEALNESDFKRRILARTLCFDKVDRADCQQLLRILFQYSKRLPQVAICRESESSYHISGMCYNSAHDELFLADWGKGVVRVIGVSNRDLRDVYTETARDTILQSVCHINDSDTFLVGLCKRNYKEREYSLVALRRSGSEWHPTHRLKLQPYKIENSYINFLISCALSDSRVLIGLDNSTYLELLQVDSGPRIEPVNRIHVPQKYRSFSATCGSDTLVAMSYWSEESVRVYRLRGDQLEELTRIPLKYPEYLLWLSPERLLASDDYGCVSELEFNGTQIYLRRRMTPHEDPLNAGKHKRQQTWCAVAFAGHLSQFDDKQLCFGDVSDTDTIHLLSDSSLTLMYFVNLRTIIYKASKFIDE